MLSVHSEPILWATGVIVALVGAAQIVGLIDVGTEENIVAAVTLVVAALTARAGITPSGNLP
jgi:hypothetical protein